MWRLGDVIERFCWMENLTINKIRHLFSSGSFMSRVSPCLDCIGLNKFAVDFALDIALTLFLLSFHHFRAIFLQSKGGIIHVVLLVR